ncbi:Uncharacterized protein DAT39_015509 [Clarias magur]|uniref:Uncharacterized protein n=1 Tax=Clarias magur TaxID=1594786 RepID=A0A8J4TPL6_CLAMG|nr:Uncharacterized protein DAT39_015509 [Clarias magur]
MRPTCEDGAPGGERGMIATRVFEKVSSNSISLATMDTVQVLQGKSPGTAKTTCFYVFPGVLCC